MKETIIKTSDVIKRALDIMGISVEAYAFSVGKDKTTIHRYLANKTSIPQGILFNVLDLLYDHGVDITKVLRIEDEDKYYYHATAKDIIFPIDVHINDGEARDFGNGFYLGENLRQSSTWGKLGYSTIIYRFKREKFSKLKVLDFNKLKPIDWLNYVAINRKKITYEKYPKLIEKYKKIEKGIDLVIGKIADSFSYEVLELLYVDKLDIDQAEYATKIMALGNQLCLKNDEFGKKLEPDEIIRYDKTLSNYFLHYAEIIEKKQNNNIELIINKPPKKERLFSEHLKKNE